MGDILDWTLAIVATLIGLRALYTIAWHRGRAAAMREFFDRPHDRLWLGPPPFRHADSTRRTEP